MRLLAVAMQLCVALVFAGERPRDGSLKVGDAAPDFSLQSPDGKQKVTLSNFKNKKPVVLVFGSYT
jgi:peroxiredoxin